jgi:hypothetical protein
MWMRTEALRRRDSRPVDWGAADGNAGGYRRVRSGVSSGVSRLFRPVRLGATLRNDAGHGSSIGRITFRVLST